MNSIRTIEVLDNEGKWIIVENPRLWQSEGITGSRARSNRSRLNFDRCWTGDHWTGQVHFAKRFASSEEAKLYLQEHLDLLRE